MFRNRDSRTVVPMTDLEKARFYLVSLEDELQELLDSGEPEDSPDVEHLAQAIEEAEALYWEYVDLETDAAIAEVEDAMERGIDLW